MDKLSQEFTEVLFNPLDKVWDDELKRLINKLDDEDPDAEEGSLPPGIP
jgi:hypothetical protein